MASSTAWPGRLKEGGVASRQTPVNLCDGCGNMLWTYLPQRGDSKLRRKCKSCFKEVEMEANLVYVNDLAHDAQGTYGISGKDMIKDPTLPRSIDQKCLTCGHNEAVFFQKPARAVDEGMKLIFMCTHCAYRWEQ